MYIVVYRRAPKNTQTTDCQEISGCTVTCGGGMQRLMPNHNKACDASKDTEKSKPQRCNPDTCEVTPHPTP